MPEPLSSPEPRNHPPSAASHRECVKSVLQRRTPARIVYAPNYWQWFAHRQNHGLLPPDLAHCHTQLDLIRHLGLDVFSRNIYSDQQHGWFGGLTEEVWDGVEARAEVRMEGRDRVRELLALHEAAQLDLVRQMVAAGVPAMMAMDNLDAAFHTPAYLEKFSASDYEKASRTAHEHGSTFFIHACGRQRVNLKLIDSLGVDGLEGVAFPPLGDVQIEEVLRLTSDRFLITGGISAMETERFQTADEVRRYVEDLFGRVRPYTHRFMLAASCNTSIRTPWKVIQWLRDAWQEFGR